MSTSRRTSWIATPLIAAAAFLGIMGLEVMIDLGVWLRTPLFLLLLTMLTVVVARAITPQRTLPTLLGAVLAIVAMVPVFAVSDEGEGHVFPTPGALGDLGGAIRSGIEYAATTVAPAGPDPSFVALITLGMIALFLATEYVAVALGAAASAGVLLLVPWLPAVIFQHRVSTVALVATIALWLIVLALAHHRSTASRRPAFGGAFVATIATLAAALLVAPVALGGPGWGMIPRFDMPGSLDGATRLNLAIDLRTSLTTNSDSPVLVYESSGSRPSAIKLYTLTDFDGVQWEREEVPLPTTPATSGVLWPTHVEGWTDRERTRLEMQVLDLQETNLPLPPTPRTVDITGPWVYDPELDEVVSESTTARDARYSVETDPSLPALEELEAVQAGPAAGDELLDPRYLAVAPAIDLARIESLSRELTADETTRHGQAVALQSYLRNASDFTYDTSVSPTGGDAISAFLDDREGYCIHFATTMVIMARTLDIPARMGHGFLPGTATSQGSYVVQGSDAHVWPEIWFPEQGWVRFEPTPAVQSGPPPSYADPLVIDRAETEAQAPAVPDVGPNIPDEPDVPDTTGRGAPATAGEGDTTIPLWAWIGMAVLVLAAGAGLWLWRMRSTSRREREYGPEVEWESLRTRLPESVRWSTALTPYEAAEHVRDRLRTAQAPNTEPATGESAGGEFVTGEFAGDGLASGAGPADGQDEGQRSIATAMVAITSLAQAVVDHRYAPPGAPVDAQQLREWADQVVAGAQAAQEVSA